MISSNLVIFGSLIVDKDVLSSFYSVSLSLAGLVDVDRAVIDIAGNEGLQSFYNHQAPA